ncbi:hypothetical protein BST81_05830 [Leptolyngbya sp. 'hensonii']|uniref:hypothetical protein n=1 Tax=Leptolyngbya sp. 'hensonii' TaxID=1922337 RepID=UPI00094FD236|nr:hypothetical protein [Leptolyngbya sp. 'hensonii']OLP19276.1 hypothetical protein BST81_05830 [Leptolyngbya sp. 'hensonii']
MAKPNQPFLTEVTPLLIEAAAAFQRRGSDRPPATAVTRALLDAERTTRQHHLTFPLESLRGDWRLCFVVSRRSARQQNGAPIGTGWYVPPLGVAQISFTPTELSSGAGTIANQVRIGSLVFQLTGPIRYSGQKNLLAFDFTEATLALLGRSVYRGNIGKEKRFADQPIGKLPFFAFFLVTTEVIAARGRGGGLALWVRNS